MNKEYFGKVFINCPYDPDYKHLFIIIIYFCYYFNFEPSFASQQTTSENRNQKIIRLIQESDYSIHDISRTQCSKKMPPRFNMPYELGLDFMYKFVNGKEDRLIILDGKKDQYKKTLSDLSGSDINAHNNDELTLVKILRNFFLCLNKYESIKSERNLLEMYLKTFNIWAQTNAKISGFNCFTDMDMFEIKQRIEDYFTENSGLRATILSF